MPVLPGTYPLSVIRGIAFDTVILLCRDKNVTITGTLSPDVTGTFILSGKFDEYDLFILEGVPSTFLYYNATATSYIIARTLTTGGLTDFWVPTPDPLTSPTGTYAAAGAYTGTATVDNNVVNLTGYTPEAVVRRTSDAEVTLDLNPSVTDPAAGEITIPGISSDDTQEFDFKGTFGWDLVLVAGNGARLGPYIKGPFVVTDNITQPVPT